MRYTLVVYAGPATQQGSRTALEFAQSLLGAGHEIYRLFFYADGVHNASTYPVAPQDEMNLPDAWQALVSENKIDAVVCIAAGLKRGLLDHKEAQRYKKSGDNMRSGFDLSGLGQLLDAAVASDRIVTFGS